MANANKKQRRVKTSGKTTGPTAHQRAVQAKGRPMAFVMSLIVVAIVAGVAALFYFSSRSSVAEQDLSVVGQGLPVVVQVHQLNCGPCNELRSNTKKAMKRFGDDELLYRVAYLHKADAIAFASKHGAARQTTLLLMDKFGRPKGTYYGVQTVDELETLFRGLL